MIGYQIDTSGLAPWRDATEKTVLRAAKLAGSSALRDMHSEAQRRVRDRKNLKLEAVSKALRDIPMPDRLTWKLAVRPESMRVVDYQGTRQVGSGVSVAINVGSRKVIAHAFIATMASGHVGVFQREGPKVAPQRGRYTGKRTRDGRPILRQPIVELFSSRISDAFYDVIPFIAARGVDSFEKNFTRLMTSGALASVT